MKKIFNYSLALFLLLFITSCDKGLDDLNKNRTTPTAIDPVFQLSNAVVNSSFPTASIIFEMVCATTDLSSQMASKKKNIVTIANFIVSIYTDLGRIL